MLNVCLLCGVLAPAVYVATDIIATLRYPGYSYTDQAVSELFAIGAPTGPLVVPLFTLSSVLLGIFAFGVWWSSGHNRPLRLMAWMLWGNAVNSLLLWNLYPMHMRGVEQTFTDMMHAILAVNPFVLASVVLGVAAFRNWFRYYSLATVLLTLLPAVLALSLLPAFQANQPTPGLGLLERVSQYSHQLWHVLFAVTLLREQIRFALPRVIYQ